MVGVDLSAGQDITDPIGNALPAGEPATDEAYLLDNAPADVTSILRHNPLTSPTNATTVTFRVTFDEDVQNVDPADFVPTLGGSATGSINSIVVQSVSVYDVVITGVGGSGVLDLGFSAVNDIIDLGGNDVGPAPTIGVQENYLIDTTHPTVLYGALTVPANNSVLLTGPTQITIEYSKDVVDGGGPDAADSPANYLLVEQGADALFTSASCASPDLVGDTPITVNSATYEDNAGAGPFVATASINGGVPLPVGTYRLFVCGTTSVYDPAGNVLNNGTDSLLDFRVVSPARLPATGFAPGRVTALPPQAMAYVRSGLWLEIPRLGVRADIVDVPVVDGNWDVSWLGSDLGWLKGSAFPSGRETPC